MNIIILGVTGSIGQQTLDIIRNHSDRFQVLCVTAYSNIEKLKEIIIEFHPKYVNIDKYEDKEILEKLFPEVNFGFGTKGLVVAATYPSNDECLVVNAIVGSAGLEPTVAAIKARRNVALANKETLVIGGELIKPLLKEYQVSLIPIDSEHSAIMQCLKNEEHQTVKRIIITASGGSFRDYTRKQLENVTVKDALKHPNWQMGAKITIDSATMMNKGLEVIEAHYLFDMPYERIETVLHPQSIIHSMVEFHDSSVIAQLGNPDMRVPINYALFHPNRVKYAGESLDFLKIQKLEFKELSYNQFPLLKLAIDAGKEKGLSPATLNAANEAAVALFLEGKISFLDIETIIKDCLKRFTHQEKVTLESILQRDQEVRDYCFNTYR